MGVIGRIGQYFNLKSNAKTVGNINSREPLLQQLQRNYISRSKMEVDTWRKAIDLARSPLMPQRLELLKIFRDALFDMELKTAIRHALIEIQAAPYIVLGEGGKEDKAAKEYFQSSWFLEFVKIAFSEELYGYALLEFDPNKSDKGEFQKCWVIPYEHYKPEKNQVLKLAHEYEGVPLADLQKAGALLLPLVSDTEELGLLSIAALAVIRKSYTVTDWSIHNEKLGKPFIWLQTPSRDKKELDRRQEFLSQFADNNWGIGDMDEKFNFLEPSNVGNRHVAFLDLIKYEDSAIERLINGQTGTTTEKAFTGAAQVHERTMGKYTGSRLIKIQHYINDVLFPFLIKHGYKLQGRKFQYTEIWEDAPKPPAPKPPAPRAGEPTGQPPAPTKPPTPEKKKLSSNIAAYYNTLQCCEHRSDKPRRVSLASINDIFEAAIKNVFDGKIKDGQLDKDVWKFNVQEIWGGVTEGFGTAYTSSTNTDLVDKLKQNTYVFAAFKNHQNMQAIADALVDANGQPRSFEDFKQEALTTSANYNTAWLEAEYQLAQRSATMAVEWQKIEANKDLLPNIKYITVGDERVRESHKKLDGVVLPIDDEFWDAFYPPNGWGCRCYTEQTDEAVNEPQFSPDEKEVPPSFRHNVGKEKKVFSDDHPYFDTNKTTSKSIMAQLGDFLKDLGDAFLD